MKIYIIKNLVAALLLLLPFTLAAQNALLGNWLIQYADDSGNSLPVQFTVKADGTYFFDAGVDGSADIEGKYTLEGDQITLEDTGGSYACTGQKGVYKVAVEADTTTLTRVADPCALRGGPPDAKLVFTKMK